MTNICHHELASNNLQNNKEKDMIRDRCFVDFQGLGSWVNHFGGFPLDWCSRCWERLKRIARTVSVISSHSEELVAHFNIANLNKSAEEFLPDKKARPDLNLQAINLI